MECHCLPDTCINNGLHQLPEDLQETYPLSIFVTLGDDNKDFTFQFCWDSYVLPHKRDQLP